VEHPRGGYPLPVPGLAYGAAPAADRVKIDDGPGPMGSLPALRRAWTGKRSADGFKTWVCADPEKDAPSGRYVQDGKRWRSVTDNLLYPDNGGGPGPREDDDAPAELGKRKTRAPEASSPPAKKKFRVATFDGLVRPPRTEEPRYKHVGLNEKNSREMARDARTQPGKQTAELLVASQVGKGNLANAGINRDHVISNFNIDRLTRACVAQLRTTESGDGPPRKKARTAQAPNAARAPFVAWMRALIGDQDPGGLADAEDALTTALGENGNEDRLSRLLASASNNLVFGQAEANQHAGHGADLPSYRGRIAPFAEQILTATIGLGPLLHHTGSLLSGTGETPVLDATSQSFDSNTGRYVRSSTPVGSAPEHRGGRVTDDLNVEFFTPSAVPLLRRNSAPALLQRVALEPITAELSTWLGVVRAQQPPEPDGGEDVQPPPVLDADGDVVMQDAPPS
jgi:hypothetical protein